MSLFGSCSGDSVGVGVLGNGRRSDCHCGGAIVGRQPVDHTACCLWAHAASFVTIGCADTQDPTSYDVAISVPWGCHQVDGGIIWLKRQ